MHNINAQSPKRQLRYISSRRSSRGFFEVVLIIFIFGCLYYFLSSADELDQLQDDVYGMKNDVETFFSQPNAKPLPKVYDNKPVVVHPTRSKENIPHKAAAPSANVAHAPVREAQPQIFIKEFNPPNRSVLGEQHIERVSVVGEPVTKQGRENHAVFVKSTGKLVLSRGKNEKFTAMGFINGQATAFVVDVDSPHFNISNDTARLIGINPCNGKTDTSDVKIKESRCRTFISKFDFGPFPMSQIPVHINPNMVGESVIGMDVLKHFDVEIVGDELSITQFRAIPAR